jgi:hypothetical protein
MVSTCESGGHHAGLASRRIQDGLAGRLHTTSIQQQTDQRRSIVSLGSLLEDPQRQLTRSRQPERPAVFREGPADTRTHVPPAGAPATPARASAGLGIAGHPLETAVLAQHHAVIGRCISGVRVARSREAQQREGGRAPALADPSCIHDSLLTAPHGEDSKCGGRRRLQSNNKTVFNTAKLHTMPMLYTMGMVE